MLHYHVKNQNIPQIQKLLENGADVRDVFNSYEPLDDIWQHGYEADFDSENDDGAEEILCPQLAKDIMIVLKNAGATVNTQRNALSQLIYRGAPVELIQSMLEIFPECEVNVTYVKGWTMLHDVVSREKRLDVLECLLKHGADPNRESDDRYSTKIGPRLCLHESIALGHLEMTLLLLRYGADPFKKDTYGLTALTWARWMRRQLYLTSFFGVTSRDHTESSEICTLIENIATCRDSFEKIKDSLHRDLAEYIWNPERLAKQGYFEKWLRKKELCID